MKDRIEIYTAGLNRKWRWRYVAANGNILADSGQGYVNRADALSALATVTGTVLGPMNEYAVGECDPRRLEIRRVGR